MRDRFVLLNHWFLLFFMENWGLFFFFVHRLLLLNDLWLFLFLFTLFMMLLLFGMIDLFWMSVLFLLHIINLSCWLQRLFNLNWF
jgi:hypothetical protein